MNALFDSTHTCKGKIVKCSKYIFFHTSTKLYVCYPELFRLENYVCALLASTLLISSVMNFLRFIHGIYVYAASIIPDKICWATVGCGNVFICTVLFILCITYNKFLKCRPIDQSWGFTSRSTARVILGQVLRIATCGTRTHRGDSL